MQVAWSRYLLRNGGSVDGDCDIVDEARQIRGGIPLDVIDGERGDRYRGQILPGA